jgi:hypothetical protein
MSRVIAVIAALLVDCGAAVDTDDVFMATLKDAGITIDRTEARAMAVAVCMAYEDDPDTDLAVAALAVMKQQPEWTPEQAGTFIGAAVGGYCPQHRNF